MRKLCIIAVGVALSSSAGAAPALFSVSTPDFSATEQSQFSGTVANFRDPSPSPNTFTIDIDWGDGAHSAGTAVPEPSTFPQIWDVNGTHTYADEGTFQVTVNVHDDQNNSNAIPGTGPISVNDSDILFPQPTNQPAIEPRQNQSFSGIIATFTDTNTATIASDLSATINWGDGSPTSVGVVAGGGGTFTVSGTHTWTEPVPSNNPSANVGAASVILTENPPGSARGQANVPVILDNEIQLANLPTTLYEGAAPGLVATFTDVITTHVASDYTAQACYCDTESCFPANVTGGNGSFSVYNYDPRKVEEGDVDCVFVDVFVKDGVDVDVVSRASGSAENDEVDVLDAPISASPKIIQTLPNVAWTGNAGGFYDANQFATTADFASASIDWGDGSALDSGTVQRDGVGGYFGVYGTHTYASPSPGPYTVTVKTTDVGGQSVTVTSQAFVLDTLLHVLGVTNTVPRAVSTSMPVATFSLSDLSSLSTDFTATIDWGDGTTADAGKILGARGSFVITGAHTYNSAGAFKTKITVTDTRKGGGTASGSGENDVNSGNLTVNVPGAIQEYAGVAFSWTFLLEDTSSGAAAGNYKITVGWGDGSADSTATVADHTGGGFDVTAGHTYAAVGTDMITVTIADTSGATLATVHLTANVIEAPADGGTGSTTSGSGSSGGCSVGAGTPSTGLTGLGAFVFLIFLGGAIVARRRRSF